MRSALQASALTVAATCAACALEPATRSEPADSISTPITNGLDDAGDASVVALLAGGAVYCSGVLVAPGAVLTAAHCVQDQTPDQILFGADEDADAARIDVLSVTVDPGYRGAADHDIAVVQISAPPAGTSSVAPLAPSALADDTVSGSRVRIVGFGVESSTSPSLRKRASDAVVQGVTPTSFATRPAPGLACFGDSGGPAFIVTEAGPRVIGIASRGDFECMVGTTYARVDAEEAFLRPYVVPSAQPAPSKGGCAVGIAAPAGSAFIPMSVLAAAAVAARRRSSSRISIKP